MDHSKFLQKLGLSRNASLVYISLLEHGRLGVSGIAKKTGLFRVNIYEALAELENDGLVTVGFKGKYKAYTAEKPSKLEARFLELANNFDAEIDALSQMQKHNDGARPIIKYVEGRKGIVAINDDVVETLKKGDVYYRYSSSDAHRKGFDPRAGYLSKKYRLLRDQKQLERKVITNVPNKMGKRPRLEREIKTVPPDFDLFEYSVSQIIYGNKVAVIDYNTETAVVIENPTIAKFQQKIFELLFRKL